MLSRFLKRASALVGLATAAVAAPQPAVAPATTTAQPALWEVSDPDTTIYLFGTIHLLPDNYQWRTPAIDTAIANSDSLVVETIVDQANPAELVAALTKLGYSYGLPPLAERVAPERRALLETAIAKTGIPRPIFDRMETWAAAFTLLGVQFKDLGLKGEHGVEQTLRDTFGAKGKPIGQLETNAEQLGFFDTLPEEAQRALLDGAITASPEMRDDFTEMLRGWATGDVDAIAKTFNRGLADSPPLREALLKRRNANWSRWIEQRLSQPGTVMVAVGAGHLAGSDSVQSMLEREGYRIRRVQ
jgi:uncharacterized protein YbaP (TraB family)